MGNLYFTIGPPRSGKSTFCKLWLDHREYKDEHFYDHSHIFPFDVIYPRVIVCADEIRKQLGFEYRRENEHLVLAHKILMIKTLLQTGHNVMVDGTHTSELNVRRMFDIDPTATPIWYPSYAKYKFYSNRENFKDVCIKRGLETKGEYIVKPIEKMFKNLETLVKYGERLDALRSGFKDE